MNGFISTRDLQFHYQDYITALRGINIDIDLGEFIAIMGENGAGKTTLVKHFNGLLKPSEGSVVVDGVDTKNATVAELSRKVGYVFQNPLYQLFSETVEKEVGLGLKYTPLSEEEKERRIQLVLTDLGIEKQRKRHPLMLSEGERKRVAIASILVMDPSVLILDEPTLGLDAREKSRLETILRKVHSDGRTVILVSHDVEFVFDTAERIIAMADGEKLFDGPREAVFEKSDVFRKAGLVEPQILTLTSALSKYGIRKKCASIDEISDLLIPLLRGNGPDE